MAVSQAHHQPPTLLTIPQELRDNIYSYIVSAPALISCFSGRPLSRPPLRGSPSALEVYASLLLVCRQISAEVQAAFFRLNTFGIKLQHRPSPGLVMHAIHDGIVGRMRHIALFGHRAFSKKKPVYDGPCYLDLTVPIDGGGGGGPRAKVNAARKFWLGSLSYGLHALYGKAAPGGSGRFDSAPEEARRAVEKAVQPAVQTFVEAFNKDGGRLTRETLLALASDGSREWHC
jgi:hypothetical protein